MKPNTYQQKFENRQQNVPNMMQIENTEIFQKVSNIHSKITPIPEIWDPNLLDLIFIKLWISLLDIFWTSILESILYLVLDANFETIVAPQPHQIKGATRNSPKTIFDGLECALL